MLKRKLVLHGAVDTLMISCFPGTAAADDPLVSACVVSFRTFLLAVAAVPAVLAVRFRFDDVPLSLVSTTDSCGGGKEGLPGVDCAGVVLLLLGPLGSCSGISPGSNKLKSPDPANCTVARQN